MKVNDLALSIYLLFADFVSLWSNFAPLLTSHPQHLLVSNFKRKQLKTKITYSSLYAESSEGCCFAQYCCTSLCFCIHMHLGDNHMSKHSFVLQFNVHGLQHNKIEVDVGKPFTHSCKVNLITHPCQVNLITHPCQVNLITHPCEAPLAHTFPTNPTYTFSR